MPINFSSLLGGNKPTPRFNFSKPDINLNVEAPVDPRQVDTPRPRLNIMDYYGQAKSPIEDQIAEYIANAPKREDYKPGKINRLGAILSGFSTGLRGGDGFGAAQDIVNTPFKNAVEDYGRKGEGLNLQVALDSQKFDRASKLASEARSNENEDRDYDLKAAELHDQMLNNKISREATQKQMEQMGFQKVTDPNTGTTKMVNPFSNKSFDLGKTELTPDEIKANELSLAKGKGKIDFNNSAALAKINNDADMARTVKQGEIQAGLVGTRAAADLAKKKQMLADKVASDPDKDMKQRWANLQAAAANDPDLYNYYEIGPDGSVRPIQGKDMTKYNQIKEILSGKKSGGLTVDLPGSNNSPDANGWITLPNGIRVRQKSGGN